jgi:hypothetical protein
VPSAQIVPLYGEAHLSAFCNHFDEIADALENRGRHTVIAAR